jgi:hypothetical protein
VEGSPGSQNSMSLSGHLLSNCGDIGLEIGRQAAWIPRANHVLALYITHPIQAVSCSQMSQGKNLLGNAPVTFRAVRRVCGHGGAILGGLATHCDGCAPVWDHCLGLQVNLSGTCDSTHWVYESDTY